MYCVKVSYNRCIIQVDYCVYVWCLKLNYTKVLYHYTSVWYTISSDLYNIHLVRLIIDF